MTSGPVVGAVLCGGGSRRMGRDKALIEVDGRALAARVAEALRSGGCGQVLAVGGAATDLARLGLTPVADRWPGAGPLAGLASALGAVPDGSTLALAPCDLVAPRSAMVSSLLAALDGAPHEVDAAVPSVGGRLEWIHSAWRVRAPLVAATVDLVESGSRRLGAVAGVARWTEVTSVLVEGLQDADRPEDLP